MPADSVTHYPFVRVLRMFGLSRSALERLIEAGFVQPHVDGQGRRWFDFQDLVLLRMADALRREGIAPRRIVAALTKLRSHLPAEMPLTGLRVSALGSQVVVHDRVSPWLAESGQLMFDFGVPARTSSAALFAIELPNGDRGPDPDAADTWLAHGAGLEASNAAEAESAYRRALAIDPEHEGALLNLGALLSEQRRATEAIALYERALASALHGSALLRFNLAIALEDLGRFDEALLRYEQALALDAELHDAHYNAACVLEKLGDAQAALRHFSAYRRARRSDG